MNVFNYKSSFIFLRVTAKSMTMDVKTFLSVLMICFVVDGQIKKPPPPPDNEGYKYELGNTFSAMYKMFH